jgi:hypothetical protein
MTPIGKKRAQTNQDLSEDAKLAVRAYAAERLRHDPATANVLANNAEGVAEGVLRILRRHWSIRRKTHR